MGTEEVAQGLRAGATLRVDLNFVPSSQVRQLIAAHNCHCKEFDAFALHVHLHTHKHNSKNKIIFLKLIFLLVLHLVYNLLPLQFIQLDQVF